MGQFNQPIGAKYKCANKKIGANSFSNQTLTVYTTTTVEIMPKMLISTLYARGLNLSFTRGPHFNKKGSQAALRGKMSPRAAIGS
jgi:hypothetical protein